jgi:imidazoleglycerol-phosphate dehydratase
MATTETARSASVARKTNETDISVSLSVDGNGTGSISTGVGFFDHMLEQLSRHSLIDMEIKAKGDLHIDDHHTVEDTGIAIGQALARALGDRKGINRYASLDLAMDETLTRAAIDISGRPFLVWDVNFTSPKIGAFDTELVREFFQALAQHGGITLHVANLYGANNHHMCGNLLQGCGSGACACACEVDRRQKRPDSLDKGISGLSPCGSG